MSLTFTDWENCTDSVTGQAFLLNWTADTGMGLYTHLEGFRQALADKYAMTGTTLTGLLASEIPLGTCKLTNYCAAIDAGVTAMIPKFVNHLDNGGNWQGQATCAPLWTSATILTAIGAASRILSGDKKQITVDWMKQVYDLLNMMRWTKQISSTNTELRSQYGGPISNADFHTAVDLAIAALSDLLTPYNYIWATTYGGFDGSIYGAGAYRQEGKYKTTGTIYTGMNHAADLYVFAPFLPGSDLIWDALSYGYEEGKYNIVDQFAGSTLSGHTSSMIGPISDPMPKYPDTPPVGGLKYRRWWLELQSIFILKWAVTGGSKFF